MSERAIGRVPFGGTSIGWLAENKRNEKLERVAELLAVCEKERQKRWVNRNFGGNGPEPDAELYLAVVKALADLDKEDT